MHILYSAKQMLSPIDKAGYPFIALFFAVSAALGFWWQPLFWLGMVATCWCIYFFRNPRRIVPELENAALSPADGKISFAGLAVPPLGLGLPQEQMLRISVFMDIFSCHINRAPLKGQIKAIRYRKGRFFNAELDKASEANEANSLLMQTAHGDIGVVQIAGLAARRIICRVKEGETLAAGQRFGLIRFGSRLDVYLPRHAVAQVSLGQSMIAGESILARFPAPSEQDASAAPQFRAE